MAQTSILTRSETIPRSSAPAPTFGAEEGRAGGDRLPPSPDLSKLTQTLRIMKHPFDFIAQQRAELGDVFRLETYGMGRMIFLCTADLLHQVYRMPEEAVVAGEIRHKQVGYLVGEKASINLDGSEYHRRRQVLTPYFSPRTVGRHTDTLRRLAEDAVADWEVGEVFPLQPYLYEISLQAIARVLYGPLGGERSDRLVELSARYLDAFRSPFVQMPALHWNLGPLTPWGRFLAIRKKLYAAIGEEIEERRSQGIPEDADDVLSGLLAAAGELEADDPDELVKHEAVGMIVGGGESTSRALIWTLLGILQNPPVLEKMRQEIDEVLGDRPISARDFCKMPYLDAVLHEGLRYQPAGPFAGPRLVKKPIQLGGYTIPPGAILLQCMREVGRSEVFPYPDRFEPDNFYGRNVKLKEWVPFGGGSRTCTGMGLARLELAVVLATWVQRADLRLGPGPVHPVRTSFLYEPANGLQVELAGKR